MCIKVKQFLFSPPLQTLYTYPENWRAFKAQIAAQYSGACLKVASNSPAFTFGQTNRTPAFLNNFPLGKVSVVMLDFFKMSKKKSYCNQLMQAIIKSNQVKRFYPLSLSVVTNIALCIKLLDCL